MRTGSSPTCERGANWGGHSSGSSGSGTSGSPLYDLGYQFGKDLGQFLLGDPGERARREEAEMARAGELARREAEDARRRDEQYQRLAGLLRGDVGGGQLALQGVSREDALGLKSSTGGLTIADIKLNDTTSTTSGTPAQSAWQQLNRAVFLSRAAARTADEARKEGNPAKENDAKIYADAAFVAATGGHVPFDLPATVEGVPEKELPTFESVQRRYQAARADHEAREERLRRLEWASREAGRIRLRAENDFKKMKSVPDGKAEGLLREATELDRKVADDLRKAREEIERSRRDSQAAERATRDYVNNLGKDILAQLSCRECGVRRDRCHAGCGSLSTSREQLQCVNRCNSSYRCVQGSDCR